MMDIVQIHPSDGLTENAINLVLNASHDGRISQSNLDFYRGWNNKMSSFMGRKKTGGEVIFLVCMSGYSPIGMSVCRIHRKDDRVSRSFTVVKNRYRQLGVGADLLHAKIGILRDRYGLELESGVGKTNDEAIHLCTSVNMEIIGEGKRERNGKKPSEYFIFRSTQ